MAERVVSSDEMAAPPSSTCSVLTTDHFGNEAGDERRGAPPVAEANGRKMGAINCPMSASRLLALSATTFRRVKALRNQMMIVARK